MLVGSALSIGYYMSIVVDQPLWDAVLTRGILALTNLMMIVIVISERTTWFMSREDLDLYECFNMLNPGQFRRILKQGKRQTAHDGEVVLTEGQSADHLYFIMSGNARVEKGGLSADIGARVFLGEIAYLRGGVATATVTLSKGTRYLVWDHADLRRIKRRNRELEVAMVAQFNQDLIGKVAGSPPAAMELGQSVSTTA